MDLVKIDHKEFGLQESKAKEIAAQFKPMLQKMEDLENEYNEVVKLPIDSPDSAAKAKELRLKYVKVRTGTASIHKEQKAFYLAGGRFVDGWKNAQVFASQGKEEALMKIEKHQENLEKERLEKLQFQRVNLLSKYVVDAEERDLSSMDNDVWDAYLSTKKKDFEDEKAAAKKAEEDRLAKEKAEKEEQERIRKENAKLKAEAEKLENAAKEAEAQRLKEEADRKEKEAKENQERQAKEKKQKEAYELKLKKEREAREKLEREEKAKREKLEAELKAKKDAEEKAIIDAEKAKEQELKKGDEDKMKDLLSELETLKTKYSFKSKENKKKYIDLGILIDKVINHIK